MAVDIKSLRIGSHISINGERVGVESLQGGDMIGYITPDNDWFATESWRFEPIPITSELLSELGFRKEDGFMRLWSKGDNGHFSYIEFSAIRDKWKLYLSGTDGSHTVVRYLHEAEALLALHGVELINLPL